MGLKEFKEKLSSDQEFAKKYEKIATPEELVDMAAKDGYTFTVDDLKNDTELTDEDMASAAGGAWSIVAKDMGVPKDQSIMAKGKFVAAVKKGL